MKILVLDNQSEFQRLLAHHVAVRWPQADTTLLAPERNGALPDDFAGAGSDVILISEQIGPMQLPELLRRWNKRKRFPPVICFASDPSDKKWTTTIERGFAKILPRSGFGHQQLVDAIEEVLQSRMNLASTQSLFVGVEQDGPQLRGYRLVRKIAGGDISSVYLAHPPKSDELEVLKVVRQIPDSGGRSNEHFDRFLQEFELISSLDHPNIVRISDFGVGDEHAYIAMEYFPDGDLKARIARGMTEAEALRALTEINAALTEMHELNILHRDLKPGNIMCREDGSIALIDFGLAKRLRLESAITGTGEIFGTPYYMSPEQGHGKPTDVRSDIYSLGVIFYEMLCQEKPFITETAMGIIYLHSHAPRPMLPSRHAHLQSLLESMLAIDPVDRFASTQRLAEALLA